MEKKVFAPPVAIGVTTNYGGLRIFYIGSHRDEDFHIQLDNIKALRLAGEILEVVSRNLALPNA